MVFHLKWYTMSRDWRDDIIPPSAELSVPFQMEHEVQTMKQSPQKMPITSILKGSLIYAFSKGPIVMDGIVNMF